ncbi:MAG: hypothetical protein WD851_08730 [Pirellulales bacterium]
MGAQWRRGAWGIGLVAAATWCAADQSYVTGSQGVAATGAPLVTHVIAQENRPHTIVAVDPQNRSLAVYHVDVMTGKLALKSVRNVTWDLQMRDYNTEDPLPQDIRSAKLAQ